MPGLACPRSKWRANGPRRCDVAPEPRGKAQAPDDAIDDAIDDAAMA